ncbi:MAG TPA: hypothetical protein VL326_10025 [Kofleriaceae bacterium]|jgi:hypothetical protein|nr:hypothetical protein [Kofleriaceae bacterium]
MRWGRQVALAAMLILAVSRPASADALADAHKAVEGSDYLKARPLLEAALKSGTQGPSDLADIYQLTGVVDGALDDAGGAQAAFGKWLALDPKGTLPKGTSPKIMRPFDAAAAKAKKAGALSAKAETTDDPPVVTLVVTNDPMKMVVGARVFYSIDHKSEQRLEAEGTGKIALALQPGKRIDLRVQGLDEYGNRVIELGSHDVPIVITGPGVVEEPVKIDDKDRELITEKKHTPPAPRSPRPWYFQWWVWGAAAVVATGTGGYFAWQTKQDIDEIHYLHANSLDHPYSDEQAAEDSARTHLLVTNIAAGAAGVFAIGTLVLYLTKPDAVATEHLSAVPVRGGGAIVLGGHF